MSLVVAEKLYTIDDYHKMIKVGIIQSNDRVELINGKILKMSPVSSNHGGHVKCINKFLNKILENVIIGVQDPIIVNNYSQPEPDITILKPRKDFYTISHPKPDDVLLLIEVSLSTLDFDKTTKLQLYASAGIQEYWIININEATVEIYRNPSGKKYKSNEIAEDEDEITIIALNQKIKASDLLVK